MKDKILIIEDESRMARLLRLELLHEGYEAEIAGNGEQGLQMMKSGEFSVVLLDYMLPGMDGIEVCRQVRTFSKVPILLLSAREDIQEKALTAGADSYMKKPFEIQHILSFLKQSKKKG